MEDFFIVVGAVLTSLLVLTLIAMYDMNQALPEHQPTSSDIVSCAKKGGDIWFSYDPDKEKINNGVCLISTTPAP